MHRCVIIGAAQIENYEKIKSFLQPDDFFIYCDGGLKHQSFLGVSPDLIVGDFDSYSRPEDSNVEIIQLPCEKDDTDSFFAVKEALRRGFQDFLLIGLIGQRFDHSLCNVSLMLFLEQQKKNCILLDDFSQMEIIGENQTAYVPDEYKYFSLMCVSGDVSGLTIENAKYPLNNAEMKTTYQYGISNEVLSGKTAAITIKKGQMLLIKVW
ncbi:MAG: thiamine diphosphokinase [Treponema sp.]|nr:thiamine diphosphokinase [Treponema sp.]